MRTRPDGERTAPRTSIFTTWLIGFAMGMAALGVLGLDEDERLPAAPRAPRASGPEPTGDAATPTPAPESCREDVAAWDAALEGLSANLRLAARVADLESALGALRAGAIDAPSFVRAAVHSMPESELADLLAAATRLDAEHLETIDDLQGYAVRLADIAMEGVLTDEKPDDDAGEVVFSSRQEGRRSTWTTAERFEPDEERLYAFFDTTDWPSGDVMVRWRHVDSGDVLLLEQHRVRAGVPRGFVWVRPSGRWQAGTYQVDVYADDEGLGHLATGRYAVN